MVYFNNLFDKILVILLPAFNQIVFRQNVSNNNVLQPLLITDTKLKTSFQDFILYMTWTVFFIFF